MSQQSRKFTIVTILCVVILMACFTTACQPEKDIITSPTQQVTPTNTPEAPIDEIEAVKSSVQVYEGAYSDEKSFGFEGVSVYYEVEVTNIQDTSFDFEVYKVDLNKDAREVVLEKNISVFVEEGDKVICMSDKIDITFTFPDNRGALPVVTDIEISGFEPLDGNTYVNNGILGYEFG